MPLPGQSSSHVRAAWVWSGESWTGAYSRAEDELSAWQGASLPYLGGSPSGPCGLHAVLLLANGRGRWVVSPSGPPSVTEGPAQVLSSIRHCSLMPTLAKPRDGQWGHRARKAEPALGLLAGCLCHRQGNQESVQAHLPGASEPRPWRDPRQPRLSGHNSYPLACQSLTLRKVGQWLRANRLWNHRLLICCVTWGK